MIADFYVPGPPNFYHNVSKAVCYTKHVSGGHVNANSYATLLTTSVTIQNARLALFSRLRQLFGSPKAIFDAFLTTGISELGAMHQMFQCWFKNFPSLCTVPGLVRNVIPLAWEGS